MGYRFNNEPPMKPEKFLPVFDLYNNEDRTWSIPCFYLDVERPIDWHDYKMHDFLGWPNPRKPGHICQALPDYNKSFSPASIWKYVDMNKAVPIHFLSDYEGYEPNAVSIVLDTKDEDGNDIDVSNIETSAYIRTDEDWIVDLRFNPTLPQFAGEPKEYLFNAYVNKNSLPLRNDLLIRGKLVVLPG